MKIIAVTGSPILFSKSPQLHRRGFKKYGIGDLIYTRISGQTFQEVLQIAVQLGVSGLNITAPFKEDAYHACTVRSEAASELHAVNTILLSNDKKQGLQISGFNTDPDGVLGALSSLDLTKIGSAVILGNSGAARAAQYALRKLKINTVVIARNPTNINQLQWSTAKASEAFTQSDLVISTVPASAVLPESFQFKKSATLLDAVYGSISGVSKAAIAHGINCISGLRWLTGQGEKAFELFTNTTSVELSDAFENPSDNTAPTQKRPVYIIGMMGSGKSSVLSALQNLGEDIIDIDSSIELNEQKSIPQIFCDLGEPHFRALEHVALKKANANYIACGGGVTTNEENKSILQNGTVIWLWSPLTTLSSRLAQDTNRPLLEHTDLDTSLSQLLTARFNAYAQAADLIISTEHNTPEEIAKRILNEIDSTR